ncbi:MAG: PEP-CTERM sorting domain-containing protein [Pseudomonadales bacterium]|nr:PEP-CTERM sorting domain-containing protein [Pseudomonadales bacterium]
MFKPMLLTVAATAFIASNAFATPVYTGSTYADFGVAPPLPNETGYYIWSNDDQTEWSVRWTANNNGSSVWGDWYGSIEFGGLDVTSTTPVLFEAGHSDDVDLYDLSFVGLNEFIVFEGYAGPHWDGFDFTIDEAITGEVIGFNLGSSLFSFDANGEQEGVGIFIGEEYASTQVLVQDMRGRTTQNFEISVPEPASLGIFALGLLGLGIARRRAS